MALNKKQVMSGVKEYLMLVLGILLYVLGWTIFLVPNNLIGGGVTGIASILQYATHGTLKIGYTYFAVNAILLIVSMFTLGNYNHRHIFPYVNRPKLPCQLG